MSDSPSTTAGPFARTVSSGCRASVPPARRRRPTPTSTRRRAAGSLSRSGSAPSEHRYRPEEHEHRTSPRPGTVAGAARGVEPGARDAGSTDGDEPPLLSQRDEREPWPVPRRRSDERRGAHRGGRGQPRPNQPHRPDPLVVRAADAVGVVVGVVDADHERDSARPAPAAAPPPRPRPRPPCRRARGDRGRQGPRPRSLNPRPSLPHVQISGLPATGACLT